MDSSFYLIFGAASLIVGMISVTLGQVVGLIPSSLIIYILYIIEGLAKLPSAQLKLDQTNIIVWLGYYILLLGILLLIRTRKVRKGENML